MIEYCAEYGLLRYALDSLQYHCSRASGTQLGSLIQNPLFGMPKLAKITQTLLPAAARRRDVPMLAILLKSISPNIRESDPWSHTALAYAAINGDIAMVDLLLRHPLIEVDLASRGMTPLLTAISKGNLNVARLLMSKGRANPASCDLHGENATKLLLKNGGVGARHAPEHLYGMPEMPFFSS